MAKKSRMDTGKLGAWAFLVGIILAVVFAFVTYGTWLPWTLVVIGLVVGLLNITEGEVSPFLMAGTILVIVAAFGADVMGTIMYLQNILNNIMMLFVPATIIVALKSVFTMARN
ncbi:hypothetical protein HOD38_03725 [archaeon]|jgi:hypothetical protein|nr:hypothetical protein [archaeon]MBT4397350.1 hypothetical protein [archaeon]MBT4440730.1 hypothetical protein [archaeon]